MNKKIINFSLIFLSLFTISSCSSNNKMDKGNNVDNITFDYYSLKLNGEYEKKVISINKDDSYSDMISQFNSLLFGVKYKSEYGITPFKETYTEATKNTIKNTLIGDLRQDGNIVVNRTPYTHVGDFNIDSKINSNTTMYEYISAANFFYIGNKESRKNNKYDSIVVKDTDIENNIGVYYNCSLSGIQDGMLEIATNYDLPVTNRSDNKFNKKDAFYFNMECTADEYNNLSRKTYQSEDGKMSFGPYNLKSRYGFAHTPTTINDKESLNLYNEASIDSAQLIDKESIFSLPESLYYLCDFSFELTDKYLIIKNKFNTSYDVIDSIRLYHKDDEETINSLLKKYKGSYEYKEVWLDYNTTVNSSIGYVYYKHDIVTHYNESFKWGDNDNTMYDKETLEAAGAYGKKYENSSITEIHWETKVIDIDANTCNKKKKEFINACKKNNVIDKYNIKEK